jgi:hypothetical protein
MTLRAQLRHLARSKGAGPAEAALVVTTNGADRQRLFVFAALRQVDLKLFADLIPRSRAQEDDGSAQRSEF